MIAIFVIVWLLCAVLCAVIAQSKGLSVGGFAVLGLLTGLIGVVIVVLARNTEGQTGLTQRQAELLREQQRKEAGR